LGRSFCSIIRLASQSRRSSAELRTTNRPDELIDTAGLRDKKSQDEGEAGTVIPTVKRQNEYQGYRSGTPDRIAVSSNSMPILIGAAIIAAAILLSALISALGTRYVGIEGPTEENAWLIDRLTGQVYRCEAARHGRANCDTEIATGSLPDRPKP
jgi:hypothetical protein